MHIETTSCSERTYVLSIVNKETCDDYYKMELMIIIYLGPVHCRVDGVLERGRARGGRAGKQG